jgi:hypothetical protein
MHGSDDATEKTILRWFSRAHGLYLCIVAVLIGVASAIALHFMGAIAAENDYEPPRLCALLITSPWLMILTAVPACAVGVWHLKAKSHHALLFILGVIALMLPLAIALYCLITLIKPLYTYEPL